MKVLNGMEFNPNSMKLGIRNFDKKHFAHLFVTLRGITKYF